MLLPQTTGSHTKHFPHSTPPATYDVPPTFPVESLRPFAFSITLLPQHTMSHLYFSLNFMGNLPFPNVLCKKRFNIYVISPECQNFTLYYHRPLHELTVTVSAEFSSSLLQRLLLLVSHRSVCDEWGRGAIYTHSTCYKFQIRAYDKHCSET